MRFHVECKVGTCLLTIGSMPIYLTRFLIHVCRLFFDNSGGHLSLNLSFFYENYVFVSMAITLYQQSSEGQCG
jgi:hypothetical protein